MRPKPCARALARGNRRKQPSLGPAGRSGQSGWSGTISVLVQERIADPDSRVYLAEIEIF